jgi:dTDP-glucose pyrophosphorylase
LEGVVIAAGEGRRMRPLTERWPKAILPIDGRPVIATLLRELAAAGLDRVILVVGQLGDEIEGLVGDGARFGLRVDYATQESPLGSADAVRRGLHAGARAPILVSGADTVYRAGDLAAAATRFSRSGASGAIGVRPVPVEELPERSSVGVREGRVVEVIEKPRPGEARTSLAGAPLWFLDETLCGRLEHLPGPPYELAVAFQAAIDGGERIDAIELGPTRDLTRPADVVLHNFAYL